MPVVCSPINRKTFCGKNRLRLETCQVQTRQAEISLPGYSLFNNRISELDLEQILKPWNIISY
jgi:hypothetical protein